MQRKAMISLLLGFSALISAWFLGGVSEGNAQEIIEGDVERGGQLYQAWDLVLDAELPDRDQPIWKEIAPDEEYDPHSWRCVSCHGWDYRGSDGWAPRAVVNRAGIPGLFAMVAEDEDVVIAWLDGSNNSGHDFSAYLSETELRDLSAFLTSGLVAPELIADLDTQLVQGTVSTGEGVYQEYCLSCHGADGTKTNFGGTIPLYLGDIAQQNPWRVAHVVRFGHLSANMPSAEAAGLGFGQQLDLISYAQTLPLARIIGSEEYPVIEYEHQANTEMLAYASMVLVVLILGGAIWVTKRKR